MIYYQSPEDASGYGAAYAFRGDELLYINSWEGNGRIVEFGSNYMQHAKTYKNSAIDAIGSLVYGELEGAAVENLAKEILKNLRR